MEKQKKKSLSPKAEKWVVGLCLTMGLVSGLLFWYFFTRCHHDIYFSIISLLRELTLFGLLFWGMSFILLEIITSKSKVKNLKNKKMKNLGNITKIICLLSAMIIIVSVASCSKSDNNKVEQNLELRAKSLGYPDVVTYKSNVTQQCVAGNHENCDIYDDQTHRACAYQEHSGTNHDGTHHNGTAHGTHNAGGHSHDSHESGNHH